VIFDRSLTTSISLFAIPKLRSFFDMCWSRMNPKTC
jgi:hypothetical protein